MSVHDEHDRSPAPSADRGRRLFVRRKVHVMATHLPEAITQNLRKVAFGGAVIQHGRWLHWFETEVYLHTVTLLRPDHGTRTIEGEALLVVAGNHLVELFTAYGEAPAGGRLEERVNRHPAAGPKLKPELLRAVSQVLAQVFTQGRKTSVFVPAHSDDANTHKLDFWALLGNDGARGVLREGGDGLTPSGS